MKVLVACEFSGVVRDAFIQHGHDAISCDLLPSESDFGPHIQGDVRPLLKQEWDMVIAHPPCTYLSHAGARWLYCDNPKPPNRYELLKEGAAFFQECLNANASLVAVENPLMTTLARDIIGEPDCLVRESWFGGAGSKRVCFWLKGLPPLMPTLINPHAFDLVTGRKPMRDAGYRKKHTPSERSVTELGLAEAMAVQWGGYKE